MGQKYFLLLMFACSIQSIAAQDTITKFYDANWKTIDQKIDAKFYRKLFPVGSHWHANDYYANGNLQMSGNFSNKKAKKRDGNFKFYYENGTMQSEGVYRKNKREGFWNFYFDDGSKDYEGNFLNNKRNGEWIFYNEGKVCSVEEYKKDQRISAKFLDYKGSEVVPAQAEVTAQFDGNDVRAFSRWVFQNINYPESALQQNISGKVVVNFVVDKTGEIKILDFKKSANTILNIEVLRVINSAPRWTPAREHNREVECAFILPVNFE